MNAIKIECGVFKVGNSNAMTLPKILLQNYDIKVGSKLDVWATDSGLFIKVNHTEFDSDVESDSNEQNGAPFP